VNKLLTRPDLQLSCQLFALACHVSRAHDSYAAEALKVHGDHGSLISGCVRDHFPEHVKNTLRAMALSVTKYSDSAYAARPRGVRYSTMIQLARAVAARDGSGYYGPRA